jgi:hypothetical protein
MIDSFDQQEIYCPHLGMMMTFHYCRQVQSALPCRNMIGCWENRLSIENFLVENFSRQDLEMAFGGLPKTKLERIFDCIERVKGAE